MGVPYRAALPVGEGTVTAGSTASRAVARPVVCGGEGRVDAAGLSGGHEQRLAEDRVAAFGGSAVPSG
jgi:hypothetical protein